MLPSGCRRTRVSARCSTMLEAVGLVCPAGSSVSGSRSIASRMPGHRRDFGRRRRWRRRTGVGGAGRRGGRRRRRHADLARARQRRDARQAQQPQCLAPLHRRHCKLRLLQCPLARCSRKSGTPTSFAKTPGEPTLLYIDLHLVHEVTSPQAFEGLRLTGRRVRRPDLTIATMDHNMPTWPLIAAGHRRRSPRSSSTRSRATARSSAFGSRIASARCRASCT